MGGDDPRRELDGIRLGAAFRVGGPSTFVRVAGADAQDYLHRMTSQDLAGLEPGRVTRTCVLTPEGRLVGAPWVWRGEDHFLLEVDSDAARGTRERLERYVITEDVRFEETARTRIPLLLAGPRAGEALADLGVPVPEAHEVVAAECAGLSLLAARRDVGTSPAFVVLTQSEAPSEMGEEGPAGLRPDPAPVDPEGPSKNLASRIDAAHLGAVGEAAWDALRVLGRSPAWGAELSEAILPLEARLESEAISFTKGCYPGQEPLAMAHHRGHPPSLLVRLRVAGGQRGETLLHQGRRVGRLTTVTGLTDGGEPNALGFVRHALAASAATLEVEGGQRAQVLEGEGP